MSADVPLAERQRAALRVCFAREPSDADLQALGAPQRWHIYRRLVRDRLDAMLHAALPRTVETVGNGTFGNAFAEWLATCPPATHYIRDIVPEFVSFAAPRWRKDDAVHPWTADLALYECALWEAALGEDRPRAEVVAFEFERVPVLNPTLQVLRLTYPVHEPRATGDPYPAEPTPLCVYRPEDGFKPGTWTLNELAADLVEEWQRGERTAAESVQAVAQARDVALDQGFIDKLSDMLAGFIERGIVLGSRA